MNSQQFPRHGLPPSSGGLPQISGNLVSVNQPASADTDGSRDAEHGQQDLPPAGGGGTLAFRDDKQETMVVRPYPQVQTHGQQQAGPQTVPIQAGTPVALSATPVHLPQGQPALLTEGQMKAVLKSPLPSRLIAPAPASNQPHIPIPPKVPGHITVTIESSIATTPSIPVATISGQQGHSSNLHHLMPANIQIIRGPAPALQIGSPAVPPQTFTSHLPRGAAAAAVMSSSKTVLRPATGAGAGPGQPTVQHIIHQTIQSRPAVTTSTAVLPTVVAPISAPRMQSPVINPSVTHSAEVAHGRPGLTIHPPPAAVSIQRPQTSRDPAARITLPSHPAIGSQKPQPPHTMTQKPIFSTVTPVAAATVAPIVATTVPSTTTMGSVPHTQMPNSTIVTMTMASHSSHATAVTTSAIPVAKVVPQPIAHSSSRVQPDYPGERTNLIPIPGHRSSPNPATMEARSDNRPSVPVQFQYFLPAYSSSYPLTHTYTPISSSVSTIRQYPVTPQAPSSALPTQPGVGVATTVHLNHMQLMAVDRIGLPSAQISTHGIQPGPNTGQGIQPAPIGVHASAPINTQGIQQTPIVTQQQQQTQSEAKSGVVLADGFVASPISSTFSTTQPVATMVQAHAQGAVGGAPTLVSSPRPSILRKKPANESCVRKNLIPAQPSEAGSGRLESGVRGAGSPRPAGVKSKAEMHMAVAPPVMATVEALPSQVGEQQVMSSNAQHLAQAIPTMLGTQGPVPSSQPSTALSALPATMAVTPPVPASMANTVASPTQPAASSTAACAASSTCPDVKIKQEVESMDTQPDPNANLSSAPALATQASTLNPPGPGDMIPGASPRKKPRKQQHVISTEESEMVETNSTDEEKITGRPITGRAERCESPPREYVDEEGVRYVPVRPRPPVTLLRHYRNPWKAAYHHFQRYSDIRVKEEKKGTLQDMANQRGVACRAQGWKIHLCAAQLRQLSNLEHDVYSRLSTLQEGLIPKKRAGADDELHRINELIQGNMQRCKLVMDQVTEARDTMMKVLDHKEKVLKLLNKNGAVKKSSKLKRKERA
ncbi:histone deacetylase complex subunit SAP130a isoform X1 [Solea solea]|uniref:histone deacetylase complex subunit SAP130a isoform X1 n=1 Tax=Solea solea TaxID=90069 RepID=UPI002729778A|nr:histone deacetylase complex subunit SAP130a isoform X1 [Solea solea]XP_058494839.1 histone deacetylase complex subunit SAP130a isoform X1 [Solea solea]